MMRNVFLLSNGDGSNMSFIHTSRQSVSQSDYGDKCQNPTTTAAAGVFAAASLSLSHSIDDEELNKLVSAPASDPTSDPKQGELS